jgi:hypothetical protein
MKKSGLVTLRDRKESNQSKCIPVSAPEVVADVSNRKIDWMIFMLASRHGNGRFVATKDDWNEKGSMYIWVGGNEVLLVEGSLTVISYKEIYIHIVSRPSLQT